MSLLPTLSKKEMRHSTWHEVKKPQDCSAAINYNTKLWIKNKSLIVINVIKYNRYFQLTFCMAFNCEHTSFHKNERSLLCAALTLTNRMKYKSQALWVTVQVKSQVSDSSSAACYQVSTGTLQSYFSGSQSMTSVSGQYQHWLVVWNLITLKRLLQ